jgi:hypothetical protein
MLRGTADSQADHRRFIERVIAAETVWGLKREDGFAWCESNTRNDTDVIVFWSDRDLAGRVGELKFSGYEPAEMTLFDFLYRWLSNMSLDGVLVGTNWTGELDGVESEAEKLHLQIIFQMPEDMRRRYTEKLKGQAP